MNISVSALPLPIAEDASPAMQQYLGVKAQHPDCLVLFQMGDFFEMFFDDAVTASKALDIALTRRGKAAGDDIPMCGVPFHAADSYIEKLMRQGFKLALCEQLEDPKEAKKRGSKAVVRREVVRILTPGTLTEETMMEARSAQYLAALVKDKSGWALCYADITTGDFYSSVTSLESLSSDLSRIAPKELLFPEALAKDDQLWEVLKDYKHALSPQVASFFALPKAERALTQFFGALAQSLTQAITPPEIAACGAILEYIQVTQRGNLPRLNLPQRFERERFMGMDAATRRNLELAATTSGGAAGSLLSVLDKTVTAAGARLIRQYLFAPLIDPGAIAIRLNRVGYFVEHPVLRDQMRGHLQGLPDMERALSRLSMGRGNPKDLLSIRFGLKQSMLVAGMFAVQGGEVPAEIAALVEQLGNHSDSLSLLEQALADQAPYHAREGNFIRAGFNPTLDQYREARDHAEDAKIKLRDRYRAETGIANLKISENNLIGMYIEVSAQHIQKMGAPFVHRQTMAGAVRYSTPEMKELEQRVIHAKEYALSLELQLFEELIRQVVAHAEGIRLAAQALAMLDVASGLAALAAERNYCRPVVDSSNAFQLVKARHPVVETFTQSSFVANDCDLSDSQRLWLMTGPNMAGKSTFLRQNALIVIMAQMGGFVPAESARIGAVDRLFSRVGAADDLARGRSTFMVEMVETAAILHQATPKSLVILDEIGRGTATYDGLSIAWAVLEYLHHTNKCRGLFATHYHELTALDASLPALSCHTVRVKEWQGDVVFLYEVIAGNADHSYGVHVGKLAGLPKPVLKRAAEVLALLETDETHRKLDQLSGAMPLFSAVQPVEKAAAPPEPDYTQLIRELGALTPDTLSPREALETLYHLKALADGKN